MADYRDPKVTTSGTKRDSGTGKWIGIALAVLVVLILIAWWTGAFNGGDVEPEVVAPATETPATGAPATTEQPVAPAQQ
jgi:Na+-transporting methylmalonyl-CoA/oxaloacetate decarboxylase gamma subunit